MKNYRVIFKLDSVIKFEETYSFNEVKLYNIDGNLYASTTISASDIEEAEKLANIRINNVCSSLSFVSGQIVHYLIDGIEDLNVNPPEFSSANEISAMVAVSKFITSADMSSASKISKLIEQSHELELVMLLVNRPDFKTWITLYKVYEIINHNAGIKKQGWLTKSERNLFRRSANHPEASNVHESRHGVQKEEPPLNPLTINEAVTLINKLIRDWIEFLKRKS